MDRPLLDALFVINQDTDFRDILSACSRLRCNSIAILSTHSLYQNERSWFATEIPHIEIRYLSFADCLTDGLMEYCDSLGTEKWLPLLMNSPYVQTNYPGLHMRTSLLYKNFFVLLSMLRQFRIENVFFSGGLGIHPDFWKKIGTCLGGEKHPSRNDGKHLNSLIEKLRLSSSFYLSPRIFFSITQNGISYVFLSGIGRIKFREDIHMRELEFTPSRYLSFIPWKNKPYQLIGRFMKTKFKSSTRVCTTIHEYRNFMSQINGKILVFVDGYHPPNYPRTYIDMYGDCIFVVKDMIGEKWFSKHGKATLKPLPFLKPEYFFPCKTQTITNILLVLNHAGDWTSLINRSDTDRLVESFAEVAKHFQNLRFIIRPHPTMIHPDHEGVHSIKRLNRFASGISNLEISKATLEKDFDRGDLFISEYSQVLLDAIQRGKLGLIHNPTLRRSFMKDYEDLGFVHTLSSADLFSIVRDMSSNPTPWAEKQNIAVKKYNDLYEEWISGGEPLRAGNTMPWLLQ